MEGIKFWGLEVGSWADWVSGIGTILAIIVSLFVLFYQTKKTGEENKRIFFSERNVNTLDEAEVLVIDIKKKLSKLISQMQKNNSFGKTTTNKWVSELTDLKNDLSLVNSLISRFVPDKDIDKVWSNIGASTKVINSYTTIDILINKLKESNTSIYNHVKKECESANIKLTDLEVDISEIRRTVY